MALFIFLTSMSPGELLQRSCQTSTTQAVKALLLLNPGELQSDRGLATGAEAALVLPINRPKELLDKVRSLIAQ